MRVTALAPFGIEIEGLDLAATISAERVDDLRYRIARGRVAIVRNQTIDDAALVRFLASLGELTFTAGETPVAGWPDLNVVSNVGRTTPPRSVFHTDTSYVARPPAYTALRPVLLPAAGGATLFSDQVAVASGLPSGIRPCLDGRTVLHGVTGLEGRDEVTRHPLLRRHPITGEVALYLSTPARCAHLSGTDERTSARVIAALYYRSTEKTALYRHTWRAGDIVIWDNRVTMHRADHDGVTGDRVLHRGMVRGEVPIPA